MGDVMQLHLSTAPTVEPLTTAEAKDHLRVTTADEDTLIDAYVKAARQAVEVHTRLQLITATWVARWDDWSDAEVEVDRILLPRPPLQSVSSVKYYDNSGTQQTMSADDYDVDTYNFPGSVVLGYEETWPTNRGHVNDIEITYVAGYGDSGSDVPEPIRQALRLLVGHLYENRESVTVDGTPRELPQAVEYLLYPYRETGVW